jgi:hypothetical protein
MATIKVREIIKSRSHGFNNWVHDQLVVYTTTRPNQRILANKNNTQSKTISNIITQTQDNNPNQYATINRPRHTLNLPNSHNRILHP